MRAALALIFVLAAGAAQAETLTCKFKGLPQPIKLQSGENDSYVTTFKGKRVVLEQGGGVGTGMSGRVWGSEEPSIMLIIGMSDGDWNAPTPAEPTRYWDGLMIDGHSYEGACRK